MNEEITAFLAAYAPPVQELALRTRAMVLEVFPQAVEQIDLTARMLAYGHDRTYKGLVCVIMPIKGALNLGFARGAELPDPTGLLEGTGKRARHVKLKSAADVNNPALQALIQAAIGAE
ncbi:MAG: DUF1801 domain-containing protein [Anaerolineaceae bacterium]|nr:DUF1801 domain-containing protein [Anaerolineaceae bacterium]